MNIDEATAEARRRMKECDLILPDVLLLDGQIHRCKVNGGKQGATDGAYRGHPDAPFNFWWKNHKTGDTSTFTAGGEKLTTTELQAAKRQNEANKIKADEDQARRWAEVAAQAQDILDRSNPLTEGNTNNNAYLKTKNVVACRGLYSLKYHQQVGAFFFKPGSLVMPIHDAAGSITSLQLISATLNADGGRPKHQLKNGRKQGCGFLIEGSTASGKGVSAPSFANILLVCEGLATGLSLWMATSLPILVAIDAGNLLAAIQEYRKAGRFTGWTLVFCADNDLKADGKANVGVEAAKAAAEATGALVVVPQLERDGQPVKCDWNDVHQAAGLEEVARQIATALSSETTRAEEDVAPPRPEKTTKDMNIMPSFDAEVTDFQSVTSEKANQQDENHSPTESSSTKENITIDDNAEIDRLAALSPLEYDRQRKDAAKRLKVSFASLDRAVRDAQTCAAIANMENLPFAVTEPWPHPVEPGKLLTEISTTVRLFVICSQEVADAVTLWVAMTWFIDVIDIAPLAIITAPEMRCGKTKLLTTIGRLSARAMQTSNISPSALFRAIERWKPTMLIDEADSCMKDNEDMRGLINSGHTRESAVYIRTVGEDFTPTAFSTWGAKAISGIGKLAGTLMDRAIVLELRRKRNDETVERLRHADSSLFDTLRAKLARFAKDYAEQVRMARPSLPGSLNDRAQDNWEPLLAIAMVADREWLKTATAAALKLSGTESATQSIGTELLIDIKEIFDEKGVDRISTAELLKALCEDDEKLWATYNRGNPITPRQISNKLKGYNISSKNVRIPGSIQSKGFERRQFDEAFSIYIPFCGGSLSVPPSQINNGAGLSGTKEQNISVPLPINPSQDFSMVRKEKYRDGNGTASFFDNSLKKRNWDAGTDRNHPAEDIYREVDV